MLTTEEKKDEIALQQLVSMTLYHKPEGRKIR